MKNGGYRFYNRPLYQKPLLELLLNRRCGGRPKSASWVYGLKWFVLHHLLQQPLGPQHPF